MSYQQGHLWISVALAKCDSCETILKIQKKQEHHYQQGKLLGLSTHNLDTERSDGNFRLAL
jgi:hypothetical protein